MTIRIGVNGLGRIGRMALKMAAGRPEMEVTAVNDPAGPEIMAHLLSHDSVHGTPDFPIRADGAFLEINHQKTPFMSEKDPERLDWGKYGADIVLECSGVFRTRETASKHLAAGASKAIISAPAKDPDATIVMGVNSSVYDPRRHHIISNASCTTNCLAPVAKVLHERLGIRRGMMTTVHSYTGDQRLMDAPHKDFRRARAAGLSMIPTTTGAAKAVELVLPELSGKMSGLAIRVPTANVSIVDFVAQVGRTGLTAPDVNDIFKEAASGPLSGILGCSDEFLVSSDFNGSTLSSVVDAPLTSVMGDMVKTLSWYDNEAGYAARMIDLALMVGSRL
ncbi:Glyceraldehyde-3-phosphate dehydrogenase [Candidatus Desulfarcum epimagneticum]|uniref:Glyceraldehyde-3-phosphate dehydrogenase n=1 Tax=uncultured Desulfobacteraceae bacterium TaxID=218296 RepID=A0A484HL19_9BACT|nr:Glyceraldehyde-3-phosphate dehydrogenase [uncultured Desulfobacteraceae bacterium]